LEDKAIYYESQKRFKGCRSKLPLPFDFWIESANLIIEFHGEQHFKDIPYFSHSTLKYRKEKDYIKAKYCKENNIRLRVIAYNEDIEEAMRSLFG
jgi:hypothetical protein